MKQVIIAIAIIFFIVSCGSQNNKNTNSGDSEKTVKEVNINYLKAANSNNKITKVPCTLSTGTETQCFQIISNSTPTDHQMGPWCPTTISDDKSKGGIWLSDGKVYDVDGNFIKNLASFYDDTTWKMYNESGKIFVTKTEQDCINAANPNVGEDYKNFCVECLPSYISEVSRTFLIPVKPSFLSEPISFMRRGGGRPKGDKPPGDRPPKGDRPERGPKGKGDEIPSTRGLALNGIEFSAPAPVNNILGAYTLAPFDDAGGHINVHQGYHYHTSTGISYSIEQKDGHPPLIGYAIDGHGIYGQFAKNEKEPADLDDCRGHYDVVRGYHYHADAAGSNNFINCIHGAYAK